MAQQVQKVKKKRGRKVTGLSIKKEKDWRAHEYP